jgi:AraC family transcriptional regulator
VAQRDPRLEPGVLGAEPGVARLGVEREQLVLARRLGQVEPLGDPGEELRPRRMGRRGVAQDSPRHRRDPGRRLGHHRGPRRLAGEQVAQRADVVTRAGEPARDLAAVGERVVLADQAVEDRPARDRAVAGGEERLAAREAADLPVVDRRELGRREWRGAGEGGAQRGALGGGGRGRHAGSTSHRASSALGCAMAAVRTLHATGAIAVTDIACRSPRSGPGAARGGEGSHVVLVRRGVFTGHVGRRAYVADPCTAMISWADTEYRISHPGDAGDDCLVIELDPAIADEALAPLRRHADVAIPLTVELQVAAASYAAAVRDTDLDAAAAEEASLALAARIAAARAGTPRPLAPGDRRNRALALAAIELIDRDLGASLPVTALAARVGCSPFHLMRVFRAETGDTIRGYRIRARLGAALHRLADGEDDLTALAHELGFASHAHLTDTFARLAGAPPRVLRAGFRKRWLRAGA